MFTYCNYIFLGIYLLGDHMTLIKNSSIKKLTLSIFATLYLIFFIFTILNLYSYSKYESLKTEKLIKNFNLSLSKQISEKINSISDVSKYPLLIPEISNLHNILRSDNVLDINNYNYLKHLCEMILIQNDSINGAYIYDLKGRGTFASRNTSTDILINPSLEWWFLKSIQSDNSTSIFSNINIKSIVDVNTSSNENLIALTRQIIDISSNEITGLLLITIPTDKILNLLNNDIAFNNQILSLYDSDGQLIAETNKNPLFNDLYQNTQLITTNTEPQIEYMYKDTSYIVTYNYIQFYDWILINTIKKSDAFNLNTLYMMFFFINLIFFLIMSAILYLFLKNRIFNPIESLAKNMKSSNLEKNLDTKIIYDKDDEIGFLVNSYNKMKNRINYLININYKNALEHKELELQQLQNQINPHFIYNTLESIHMMAEINDDIETSTMAEYFGEIIRYSMNRRINTVTLKEELKIIDNYIYLQKIRFDQLFTIENMVSDELLSCEIIKMIIQPLIENAIYHGLSECSGNGKIIIQGSKVNNNLLLTISDNGIGIPEEKLQDLNDYINDKNHNFNGIALRNINKRLKLNYGENYGLEIFSIEGNGTSMVLTLPFIIK
ncbi:ATPase/histidine kinase/DNA gyrase B/HSP90 domain protein [Clostridium celatum DSM 1785]|uniref:histidine kinase n=2 Tax=Clostridium celatum TaxID=36834 RepID=L1QJN3_9CLOT|nr:ATPase/histidine kinase/DNA gyrase B/HSP90 domain protein [Clostridium celatum DSM 1785]